MKSDENIKTKIELLYIWLDCVLDVISAKQYCEIKKKFEERIKLNEK